LAQRLTAEERAEAKRLYKTGLSQNEIGRQLGRTGRTVGLVLHPPPSSFARLYVPGPGRLLLEEREEVRAGLVAGETYKAIAGRLGRAPSTVSREVAAHGGREHYRAWAAHRRAALASRRPKCTKLAANPALVSEVEIGLAETWSPEQVAKRLRQDFPHDPMMWVSHETIYKSLFVQGRGELRRELARCLRTGRAQRRPQKRQDRRGRLADMVMISERPAEVQDRAVPGHWEGDLVLGSAGSAVGTLVERTTRYLLLLHLPEGRSAGQVRAAMQVAIGRFPGTLARSVTWDQGKEMAEHLAFTVETGIQVYFCDPHSPWQRGSNENTNGLLRQFMPKGTNLRPLGLAELAEIERKLNGRPRETLGWRKPCEKMAELIALTA
jgi:transposase, IS30 family